MKLILKVGEKMKKNIKQLFLSMTFTSLLFCGHFTPAYLEFSANPYLPMSIYVTSAQLDGVDLAAGDEIGIYDGLTCVGTGTVTSTITATIDGMLKIDASANDVGETTTNGFSSGNAITYYIWDASANKRIWDVTASYPNGGDDVFTTQGTAYATLAVSAAQLSVENIIKPNDFQLHSVYPNPFNPITNITYELAENSNVNMIIYDISGKLISSLINEFQPAGFHAISWDASSQPSGIYLLQLNTNKGMETKKITCIK